MKYPRKMCYLIPRATLYRMQTTSTAFPVLCIMHCFFLGPDSGDVEANVMLSFDIIKSLERGKFDEFIPYNFVLMTPYIPTFTYMAVYR